jgi:hypothetical protein
MYASIEYLLTGLPVVSTLSLGGRDYFFDDDFVRIVDPDPRLVRAAVDELARAAGSREEIRRRTLATVREQRSRFVTLLDELGVALADLDAARLWSDRFRHGMLRWGRGGDLKLALGRSA